MFSAGLASSTTLMEASLARFKNSFPPASAMEPTAAVRGWKSTLAPVTASSGSSARLLVSPGTPSLKSRSANAALSTAATRLLASSSNRYFTSSAIMPSRIWKRTRSW